MNLRSTINLYLTLYLAFFTNKFKFINLSKFNNYVFNK